ncbi:hypothetical protein C4573_04915 [Candidatus Woesearchaeota archaeon]|nr:MAG: hypothetical protein C4573_04915 [Candidatus Woesearchaeota archaeon]
MERLQELIALIKQKRELKNLDDDVVREKIMLILKKNNNTKIESLVKKKDIKKIIKETRAELRKVYGVFLQDKYASKDKLLEELVALLKAEKSQERKKEIAKTYCDKILLLHQSTKERLPHYEEVYSSIFKITKKPKSILDLACGLNPASYFYLHSTPHYFASDLNQDDSDFLNRFFQALKVNGHAEKKDLLKEQTYQKADVCFLFKALDSLERVKRNVSKELLQNIPSSHIVVSFPKASLSSKKTIRLEKRNWFFRLLKELAWEYQTFEVQNELFFVVKKK